MRTILYLTFLFFSTHLFAQDAPQKLLVKILAAHSESDGELVLQACDQLMALQPPDSLLSKVLYYRSHYMNDSDNPQIIINNYEKLLARIKENQGEMSSLYVLTLSNYAYLFRQLGHYNKTVDYYKKALKTAKSNQFYIDYCNIALDFGDYYESVGAMKYAIRYYKESLKYLKEADQKNTSFHIYALHNLARVSEIEHRYDQAEFLYKEALKMAEDVLDKKEIEYLILLNDFGMLYFFTRKYKKALPFFEQIQQAIEQGKMPIEPNTAIISNLADCYAHLGRYEEAEKLYLEMEEIERTVYGESYYVYPTTISRIGDLYAYQGRNDAAKEMHLRAIKLAKTYFPPQDLYLFYNLEQAYLFFEKIKDWKQVQRLSIDCFKSNCMDPIPESGVLNNIQQLAKEQTFATIPYALKALKMASKGYWQDYILTKEVKALQQAYEIQLAIRVLLHRVKNSFSTDLDKLEFLSTTQEISELGIKIAQELYQKTGELHYQETAFSFLENNKYLLLQDALQAKEAQAFGDVPSQIIEQELALDQDLLIAKTQKINAYDELSQQAAIRQYNDVLQKIDQFKSDLESNHPNYYAYKYATTSPSIKTIQQQLKKGVALIEYFVGKDQIHSYILTQDQIHYISFDIPSNIIHNQVKAFRKELTDYKHILGNKKLATQNYQGLAYWFYQQLVAPILVKIPNCDELIIVPDGLLGHLPFEAFLSSSANQTMHLHQLDFLVRKYKISYAYSSNLLLNNRTTAANNNGRILAMGASYDPETIKTVKFPPNRTQKMRSIRQKLIPLDAVQKELNTLENSFEGTYYYGDAANEQTFKKEAAQYAILHLATHGLLDQKHPILSSLAFTENLDLQEDNFLQAYEISQCKLNAELVVLSACETGYGKFQQGEGVMSLARSFMYAGVPAMVVSMWQVNDASTSIIMQLFYQNLSQGMNKAMALQQAKLNYIDLASGFTAHPAFWAPFIQLGDSSPIQLSPLSPRLPWITISVGLGFLSLIIIGLLFKRQEKI